MVFCQKKSLYTPYFNPKGNASCETWSLILKEEHRLRVFENRVLRRVFGPKRDGVTGEWRKLHNEELNDLYSSPIINSGDKIVKNEMGGARSQIWGRGDVYTGFW